MRNTLARNKPRFFSKPAMVWKVFLAMPEESMVAKHNSSDMVVEDLGKHGSWKSWEHGSC
jgi:hypothetical protein